MGSLLLLEGAAAVGVGGEDGVGHQLRRDLEGHVVQRVVLRAGRLGYGQYLLPGGVLHAQLLQRHGQAHGDAELDDGVQVALGDVLQHQLGQGPKGHLLPVVHVVALRQDARELRTVASKIATINVRCEALEVQLADERKKLDALPGASATDVAQIESLEIAAKAAKE